MNVAVIGAGAWGTALAITLAKKGNDVTLWAREGSVAEKINKTRENKNFLPGFNLPERITAISDIKKAIIGQDVVFIVSPAQYVRAICTHFSLANINTSIPLVICSKGIEEKSGKLLSEVVKEVLPYNPVAVLSGPTFAKEVARGSTTSVNIACIDREIGVMVDSIISNDNFKTYYSDDIVAAQIGGAVKNVIAIGCGIFAGRQMGENARAAFITKGITEIRRLIVAKGGRAESSEQLCCFGDLILTCSSKSSRNYSLGYMIGQGMQIDEVIEERRTVTEGVASAVAITRLAQNLNVDMPVCMAINEIVNSSGDVSNKIDVLLQNC